MNNQKLILLTGGILLVVLLYFFGNTNAPVTNESFANTSNNATATPLTTPVVLDSAKKNLNPEQLAKIMELENSVVRGDVKTQKIRVFNQLASYWGDTLKRPDIGAYYAGEAAKLENSEKSLNFAARLLFDNLLAEDNPAKANWLASNAKALYEQSLQLDPNNDSLKIELGACYIFGNLSSTPMEGILKIKEVADRDSTNMYAQFMLGLGDIRSAQYDKAIERFEKVIKKEPDNLQAILNLAETYERNGDKKNAVHWYREAEKIIDIPAAKQELEKRINSLQ